MNCQPRVWRFIARWGFDANENSERKANNYRSNTFHHRSFSFRDLNAVMSAMVMKSPAAGKFMFVMNPSGIVMV
jgi:hypothetical protein